MFTSNTFTKLALACAVGALMAAAPPSEARVTRIISDTTGPNQPNANYETLTGRAFGELDPADTANQLITDINLAPKNVNGKVDYIASFVLRKPKVVPNNSVMWHDVPNRGGDVNFPADSQALLDIQLLSGWQGDNAGANATSVPANAASLSTITPANHHWVKTPVLVGVTGKIVGRIVNRSGLDAAPLNVMGNPIPYFPANVSDNTGDTLTIHTKETLNGVITEGGVVPNGDWKYCGPNVVVSNVIVTHSTFDSPQPITTLPVNVCMKNGFDGTKLYQLVYTVKDPYVLGAGTAAFRDVQAFFRYEPSDGNGYTNPLFGTISKAIVRRSSQSGNFTRHFIFLGMNKEENGGRIVHDGVR